MARGNEAWMAIVRSRKVCFALCVEKNEHSDSFADRSSVAGIARAPRIEVVAREYKKMMRVLKRC